MIAEKIPELKSLLAEEKLILVGELWNELAAQPDAFPSREDHIQTSPRADDLTQLKDAAAYRKQ
jgi:hypothetical protein